jgi:glyoxylase-like metal-dependent hydrolase (beta-lactamase superfamily II)
LPRRGSGDRSTGRRSTRTAALLAAVLQGSAASAAAAAPARFVAPDVFLIAGDVPAERAPDGNTVVLRTASGLIVVDTGRHREQSDAILAFAASERLPVAAIVNTHWHLDHSSGNGRLKAVFRDAPIYATSAVDRALAAGGFLARALEVAKERLAHSDLAAVERFEATLFVATMAEREMLRPTLPLARSRRLTIAGKSLDVRVTDHAVTDADVWLYDPASRVAVVGDLVTLPAPFFDTACPREWSEALDEVWATSFVTVVPGHGEPMTRPQFDVYRAAFNDFLACVASDRAGAECAAAWAAGIAGLEPGNARLHGDAVPYAAYYVGLLRNNGGKSADCVRAS